MKKLDKLFKNQEKIQENVKNILDRMQKDLSDDNSDCVSPPIEEEKPEIQELFRIY